MTYKSQELMELWKTIDDIYAQLGREIIVGEIPVLFQRLKSMKDILLDIKQIISK